MPLILNSVFLLNFPSERDHRINGNCLSCRKVAARATNEKADASHNKGFDRVNLDKDWRGGGKDI